jgi:hypothetical protein
MDEGQVADVTKLFPACPEEVVRLWLAPYVDDIGLPRSEGRWLDILGGRPIEFWQGINWVKEERDFSQNGVITADCARCLNEMHRAYFENEQNAFACIENGRDRTIRAMVFLRENQILPGPLVAIKHTPESPLEIVDGSHRLLGYHLALKMPFQFNRSQAVWVGRP